MRVPSFSPPSPPAVSLRHGRARRLVATVVVLALAGGVAAPAVAQQDWRTDEERQASEARRQRQSELSGELNSLRGSDVELEARADALAREVEELEARTAEATAELDALTAQLEDLEANVAAARAEAEERARVARARVVQAYMRPPADTVSIVFGAADLTEAENRRALVDQVAAEDRRALAESRRAADELARIEAETEGAAAALRDRVAANEADLARLRGAREEIDSVAAALDGRIAAVQSEAASLAASEADLMAIISRRQAAATTTTTTAPPSPPPGGGGDGGGGTPTTSPPSSSGGALLWPANGVLTSTFGWRWGAMHRGIDIGAPSGTPIYAAAGGTVFYSGWMGGYGNLILIDHGDGRVTAYAHQSSLAVSGGSVGRGQVIGYVGSTGDSTGPHLHFEVRVNGTAVDPLQFLG